MAQRLTLMQQQQQLQPGAVSATRAQSRARLPLLTPARRVAAATRQRRAASRTRVGVTNCSRVEDDICTSSTSAVHAAKSGARCLLTWAPAALGGLLLAGPVLAEEMPAYDIAQQQQQQQEAAAPSSSVCAASDFEDATLNVDEETQPPVCAEHGAQMFNNLVNVVEEGLDGANLAHASIMTLGPSNGTVWLNTNPVCHVWEAYCTVLQEKPVATQIVTGLLGTFLGDLVAQGSAALMAKENGSEEPFEYDLKRLARLMAYSGLIATPICQAWFHFLDTIILPSTPTAPMAVLGKVACDQLLMAPILTCLFFSVMKTMEGHPDQVTDTLKNKLKPVLMANYSIWPLAHMINFALVPSSLRILYVNVISIFWSAYMSHAANSKGEAGQGAGAGGPGPISRQVLSVLHNRGGLQRAPSLRGR